MLGKGNEGEHVLGTQHRPRVTPTCPRGWAPGPVGLSSALPGLICVLGKRQGTDRALLSSPRSLPARRPCSPGLGVQVCPGTAEPPRQVVWKSCPNPRRRHPALTRLPGAVAMPMGLYKAVRTEEGRAGCPHGGAPGGGGGRHRATGGGENSNRPHPARCHFPGRPLPQHRGSGGDEGTLTRSFSCCVLTQRAGPSGHPHLTPVSEPWASDTAEGTQLWAPGPRGRRSLYAAVGVWVAHDNRQVPVARSVSIVPVRTPTGNKENQERPVSEHRRSSVTQDEETQSRFRHQRLNVPNGSAALWCTLLGVSTEAKLSRSWLGAATSNGICDLLLRISVSETLQPLPHCPGTCQLTCCWVPFPRHQRGHRDPSPTRCREGRAGDIATV